MLERILLSIGYELTAIIFLAGLVKRVGQRKLVEKEYDWLYFLRFSMGTVLVVQAGFVVLVSGLFWKQHSMAVGLTTLIGIPMVIFLTMLMMRGFAMNYRSVSNIIHRLEHMTPEEREAVLESLPPEVFQQLPGDYRFVSKKSDR